MDDTTAKDLLELLNLPAEKGEIKKLALQHLLDLTGTDEGCLHIARREDLLNKVLKLMLDKETTTREQAQKCVINLTASSKSVEAVLQAVASERNLGEELLSQYFASCSSRATAILNNLTRTPDGAELIGDIVLGNERFGLSAFLGHVGEAAQKEGGCSCSCTIVMNLAQGERVRGSLLTRQPSLFHQLLAIMTLAPALAPIKGVVGAIKNCCFQYELHPWLLGEEVDLLPKLLLPLAGPEEFEEDQMDQLPLDLQYLPDSKQREADPQVRCWLIQAVHQLCNSKAGRDHLKKKNTYVIMKALHEWETNEVNDDAIFQVIDILIGDEPEQGMENLVQVQIPEDVQEKFHKEDLKNTETEKA